MNGRSGIISVLVAVLALGGGVGCAGKREAIVASSAGDVTYAANYTQRLQAQAQAFDAKEGEARRLADGFTQYPDAAKAPKATVLQVVEEADQAGRGASYAERARELESVATFMEEEKAEIGKKVGGSVGYAAKQGGCNGDFSGVAMHALKEVVEKQSTERQRERNGAHMVIERNRIALGKPAAATLEKQADEIARAAYLAHVELAERKARVDWMLEESDTVKKTASRFVEREKAFQAEPGRTEPEKKTSEERIATVQKSIADIDTVVAQSRESAKKLEERIKVARKGYADALAALKQKLK